MNFARFLFSLLLINTSNGISFVNGAPNFSNILSLPSGLELKWESGDPEWITFSMKAPTNGYIGIGFSRDGRMSQSDIYIGWVDSSTGKGHIKDLFSGETIRELFVDTSQDLELIEASEIANWTSITFRRRWDTCDNMDFPITEDTMRLIWAWSDEDPVENTDGTMKLLPYHEKDETKRGVRSVFMKTQGSITNGGRKLFPDEEPIYPEDMKHFDFTVSNVVIPKAESYRHCRIVKFPTMSKKHHVVAYRPILVSEGQASHLNQINLFRCDSVGSDVFEKFVDYPGQDCFANEASLEWYTHCSELRTTLSLGAEGDVFPEHLGQPIGTKDAFYLLEMSYENLNGNYAIDSSGVRVFFSSQLRKYDVGLMLSGHRASPLLSIPPMQQDFTVSSLCSAECTANGIRPEGIKIVSVLLRAHLAGRTIRLRHVRKGRELAPIAYDSNFDYKYQNYRRLLKEVTVLPGDELIVECSYDTSRNRTFIYGGMSTNSESCEAALLYYPKSALMDCRSEPEFLSYVEPLGIKNITAEDNSDKNLSFNSIIEERMPEGMTESKSMFKQVMIQTRKGIRSVFLSEFLSGFDWNNDYFTKLVENKWRTGVQSVFCYGLHGQRINTTKFVKFPSFIEHMKIPSGEERCFAQLTTSKAGNSITTGQNNFFQAIVSIITFTLFSYGMS